MQYDVILVGAGLSGILTAALMLKARPDLRLLILEGKRSIPQNKTWCFHEHDVEPGDLAVLDPFLYRSWSGYDVIFPGFSRSFCSTYYAIRPESLWRGAQALGVSWAWGQNVATIRSDSVETEDGSQFRADCVLDARGFRGEPRRCGFQKFVGLHLKLTRPHRLTKPILMDATVVQDDGYRFFYVLPWSQNECLIEDTFYSHSSTLPMQSSQEEIFGYAARKGWMIEKILDRESGVLPIPLVKPDHAPQSVGTAAGFIHPVTGYTLPDTIRVARALSSLRTPTTENAVIALNAYRSGRAARDRFLTLLNRMMFLAAEPADRYRIFERFYGLPEPLIQRFYSGRMTTTDGARLVIGRPPVQISKAIRSLFIGGDHAL